MAEPTLAVAYAELRADVGHFLGYGRAPDNWTDAQADDVTMVLRTGLRQFYNCGFDWSFLKPVAVITLGSGDNTVTLPDDFSEPSGPAKLGISGSAEFHQPLPFGPWQVVYENERKYPDTTGVPRDLCVEPIKGTHNQYGQRMQLHWFPVADREYTLTFAYRLNANALSANLPYAYGGAQHAQTLLQSCKAAAERDIDNVPEDSPGAAQQKAYARMLEESKMMDRRTKPHTCGYNGDRSDDRRHGRANQRALPPITIQGVLYD